MRGTETKARLDTDLYILPGTSDPSRVNPGTRKPPTSAASDHDLRNVQKATGGADPKTGKARLCRTRHGREAHHRQGTRPRPSLTIPSIPLIPTCHARSPKNAWFPNPSLPLPDMPTSLSTRPAAHKLLRQRESFRAAGGSAKYLPKLRLRTHDARHPAPRRRCGTCRPDAMAPGIRHWSG